MGLKVGCNLRYAKGLARAALGAMIFALPLTMTAEMWELGVTIAPIRALLVVIGTLPLLVALSFFAGFERTFSLLDNVLDAFAAMAVSAVSCLLILALFGEIGLDTPLNELVGKLSILSFAASIGALLADKQFNDEDLGEEEAAMERGFGGRMFVMGTGAIFLALNIAPTEEVILIAATISPFQIIALACISLALLFLVLSFADRDDDIGNARHAARALAGYGVCLILSACVLWVFGRMDGVALEQAIERVIVLAFPAALGAGAARLIFGDGESDDVKT